LTARLGHPVIALLLALGCWQAALGQQPGRSSYFVHDPSLLAPASRFGDLEISLPRGFTPLPDSLRQALDELGQSGDEAFAYRVHGLFRGPDGTAISVREALGVSPDSGFSYLARYAPATSTGERLEYSAKGVYTSFR